MKNFTFQNCTKIIFGTDACEQIGRELKPRAKKIMLTYGKGSIKSMGLYDKVISQLKGFEVKEFGGIEPNPRIETLREAVKLAKEFKPDLLLAVGGGSVIDGTKLIAAAANYEGDAWDIVTKGKGQSGHPAIPIASVLTVSATGSEMNGGAVITNWTTHQKMAFGMDTLKPVVSFLDPTNTMTLSPEQTAYGIVDIFSHVLEQYMNTSKNVPLQDRWSESILATLIETAPVVLKNGKDYDARANIMLCSTMALNGLLSMGVSTDWATHNIEHELSAFYDIPHGLGLAIVTPRWMNTVRDQKADKIKQMGERIFHVKAKDSDTKIAATIKALFDFFASLGITMNLTDLKINAEHFPEMADRLAKRKVGEFALTREQVSTILNECL